MCRRKRDHADRALIGDPTIDVEIISSSVWYVNQAYAPQYSKGRVFCGGDAVHRHPPSSGLGSNTCVQDAFNLAWKLAFVLKGFAGEGLLASYSDERAPIGKQVVLRANQSRLDYAAVNACFRVEGAQNPIAAGIERFKSSGPEGVTARRQIEAALEVKNSEFNAHGVELNQRYVSEAVVPDPAAGEETWQRDAVTHYQPTTRPGAKLPHVWLVDRHGRKVSTLDVTGRGMFSLITGLAGTAWVGAAKALNLPFLRVVLVGAVNTRDLYCDWQRVREVEEAGVVLVRPDGYVAWREPKAALDLGDALRLLGGALATLLDDPHLGMQDLRVERPL
jgi:2,4-dichlorophenol 6-monooxygenase